MMNTNFAVVLGITYSYLPFMVLPLYATSRSSIRLSTKRRWISARGPSQVFRDVTLPLSIPGIIAGGLLVFIPATGELIIPRLIGRAPSPMIGRVISDRIRLTIATGRWPRRLRWRCCSCSSCRSWSTTTSKPRRRRGHEVKSCARRSIFLLTCLVLWFRVLLYPDPVDDLLLVQQVAARHRLGRLLDRMVLEAIRRMIRSSMRRTLARDRPDERHARDYSRDHGGHGVGPFSAVSGTHAVFGSGLSAADHAARLSPACRCCCCSSSWSN